MSKQTPIQLDDYTKKRLISVQGHIQFNEQENVNMISVVQELIACYEIVYKVKIK